jgi:hypothetical protein
MIGSFIQWNPDDEEIDILGHQGVIMGKYKKIANHDKFEVWLNTEYEKTI